MSKNIKNSKDEVEILEEEKNNMSKKYHKYFGYKSRVFINLFSILIFLSLSIFFLIRSFSIINEQNINYRENSNLNYKVYLKENPFYESEYLEKDMIYIASLIKKIDIDFDYTFNIDKISNITFDYDIIGKLVITDSNGTNTFFEKEYVLLDNVNETVNNKKEHEIKKSVTIDYDEYNSIANSFKASYGVDTASNLIVYLRINEHSNADNDFSFNNNSTMTLSIPLSERAINIKMDYKEVNESNSIIDDSIIVVNNYFYTAIGIIFTILTIIFVIKLLRLLFLSITKKSSYDKYINRVLNEYDRLIVETSTAPDLKNARIIKINKFEELLDVRDNLKLPIKYYVVNNHQKCNFYINHGDELYLLVIKAIDIEERK